MDMDNFQDDIKIIANKGKKKSYEVDYDDLTQAMVEDLIKADVDHISSIFGVDVRASVPWRPHRPSLPTPQNDAAALLLRHLDWNKDRLIDKFLDNSLAISVAAGISPAPPPSPPSTPAPVFTRPFTRSSAVRDPTPPVDPRICTICFDDSQTKTLALVCGHTFCTDCWSAYVTSKIREEGEHHIVCMAEDCGVVCTDTFVRAALDGDVDTVARFHELLVRSYVASNPNLKFCPYPSCSHTVSCPSAASRSSLAAIVPTVVCGADSKHLFCFGCAVEGDHRPVLCSVAKMWLQKCHDDSETANWIKSNTKECSKCQSTIEKNGGCK